MTANRSFKRRVRARAAKTGESYTAALRHLRTAPRGESMPENTTMRLSAAQLTVQPDPGDTAALHDSGRRIRALMRQAHQAGARLLHLPEGALACPDKRIMSATGPDHIGPADWDRADWPTLTEELRAISGLAAELRLWTVLGSLHPLTPPHRPHLSLYVIRDDGAVVTRYDERMLSNTKVSHLYTPGSAPVVFTVDGVRFGCAMGMEAMFPEIFLEYERLDVDCVLFSTHGPGTPVNNGPFALQAQALAAANSYPVSYAGTAQDAPNAPSGIISPYGDWLTRCPPEPASAIATADLDLVTDNPARPWRRVARSGLYARYQAPDDPRSLDRAHL
ncbi:amidohydrolase [Actinoplanes philippinensis]|uniref:Predicted amidohydrolase n=1 Tax=Actinoplanes philippinensis TaxID=35752 RepID=A0A1I2G4X5_9ACTN|nr:carbon-nitrogen hydrolase family protein [Actinoplanes philippinensis]GIE76587.1 amidohydrolase [Actinoplanes philippinensis]SFF12159.1 Predicted amidohydrolase [Actinoplanes philippinensis]